MAASSSPRTSTRSSVSAVRRVRRFAACRCPWPRATSSRSWARAAAARARSCTCSAASWVTLAAVSLSAVTAGSATAGPLTVGVVTSCDGAPGCKSTRTELLPGRMVRRLSPATTSTSNGGNTVRVVTTGGGGGTGTSEAFAAAAAARCLVFAATACFAFAVGACTGAILFAGEFSTGCSDSASCASSCEAGNQKSLLRQSTMPKASSSRHRDPTINLRCLGSCGARLRRSARTVRSTFATMVFKFDMPENRAPGGGLLSP